MAVIQFHDQVFPQRHKEHKENPFVLFVSLWENQIEELLV